MTLQIWIDDQIADRDAFARHGDIHAFAGRTLARDDLRSADVLIVRSVTRVDRSLLERTPVRFVGTVTTGVDHIDTDYLSSAGIEFATAAGFNARPVAEYVLAAILLVARDRGVSADTLTLGVVGVGRIGSLVSRWCELLGLRVLNSDPPLEAAGTIGPWTPIDELLAESDIVSLHVPFRRDGEFATHEMVNDTWLKKLNHGATLINTSRGGIVDETALKACLMSNMFCGPVIDTWVGEPNIDRELVTLSRIATPHIAGHSVEAKRRGSRMIRQSLETCLRKGVPSPSGDSQPNRSRHAAPRGSSMCSLDVVADAAVECDLAHMDMVFRNAMGGDEVASMFEVLRCECGRRHEYSHDFDDE